MIYKPLTFPLRICKLQALAKRLPYTYDKYEIIQTEIKTRTYGYKGEKSLEYPFSFLPDDFRIFFDLRLHNGTHFFQIDALIVTSKFLLVVEAKYLSKSPLVDNNNQLIQDLDGQPKGSLSPFTQVFRQRDQLEQWIATHGFPQVPIYPLVASSHPTSVIRIEDPSYAKFLTRTDALPEKIKEIQKLFKEEVYTKETIELFTGLLLKNHQPFEFKPLPYFNISYNSLRKGVICSKCDFLPMLRRHGTWFCPKCNHTCKEAHLEALRDYTLLIGDEITSRGLRDFLAFTSADTAKRLLSACNIKRFGGGRGVKYRLPDYNRISPD
ncbi:nuclease-related domain-containing protein [Thalassobacillus hwangdonensis]|uniref:Nuclease-related domain-containing protein n=1 Tax=Thalassobacillus hwangdonensis TaxID=546108 RepID=A0ABW3L2D5_9BACI